MWKYNRANAGTNDIDTINSNERIAEMLYSLRDMVCLRNICINTLHKGDDDDNDDDDDDDDNNNNNNNNLLINLASNSKILEYFLMWLC